MTNTLETLKTQVLRLSPAERGWLLDRLIVSLDEDAEAEARDLIADQREQELLEGDVVAEPVDAVIARVEARFPA